MDNKTANNSHSEFDIWGQQNAPRFSALSADIACDVLVIGGGIAGILIAHTLKNHGQNVVVAEAKRIGQGVTKGTTAVISAQHDTLYHEMALTHSKAKAKQYLDANTSAVEKLISLAEGCDLQIKPSVMYSRVNREKIIREAEFLRQIGANVRLITDSDLPFSIKAGVAMDNMAQMNPLKLIYKLAQDLTIYEQTFITKIRGNTAFALSSDTEDGVNKSDKQSASKHTITAKHIVVATHYPLMTLKNLYFLKLCQRRSYVAALKNAGSLDCTYTSVDRDGMYFRDYGGMLLVGGGDRRVGKHMCASKEITAQALSLYPQAEVAGVFSSQDCVTLDGVPYIGRYGSSRNLYTATGFGEWGMSSSMVAAEVISGMILNKPVGYANVFNPRRSMMRVQLLKNLASAVLGLITPTPKRCTHMGCALRFNRKDRVWECPCHGSRFSQEGKLMDSPAKKDL